MWSMPILGHVILPLSIYKLAYKFTRIFAYIWYGWMDGSRAIFGPNNNKICQTIMTEWFMYWFYRICIGIPLLFLVTLHMHDIAQRLCAICCVKLFGKCNHKLCPHVWELSSPNVLSVFIFRAGFFLHSNFCYFLFKICFSLLHFIIIVSSFLSYSFIKMRQGKNVVMNFFWLEMSLKNSNCEKSECLVSLGNLLLS